MLVANSSSVRREEGLLSTSVHVRVNTGVSGVGCAAGVRTVCSLGLLVSLVGVKGVLNLVDDSRHVGWVFGCLGVCDIRYLF